MPLACIHTHTNFCDGSDDIETCCQIAHRKGLESLGFSSHAPIFRKTGIQSSWVLSEDRLAEYIESVEAAKKRWKGKLPVYLGLEVEYIPGLIGPGDKDYREMNLDYIIASVHYVTPQHGEPFTVDDSYEKVCKGIKEGYGSDPMGMVEAYYRAEASMIREGGFDVLGHPDLVKKNNSGPPLNEKKLFSEDENSYKNMTSEIASLMAGTGFISEVNTGGINRGKIKDCYPSLAFLKLFREQGIQMVINADAHKAEDVDGHYGEARETMLAAGYKESMLFEGRINGKAVWKSEKL